MGDKDAEELNENLMLVVLASGGQVCLANFYSIMIYDSMYAHINMGRKV